jgi:hypothetical protein
MKQNEGRRGAQLIEKYSALQSYLHGTAFSPTRIEA